ncbi:MAG: aspartate dehydrogenase [Candidatus Thermoplasmatota archaeon]|nr:aspartate dehydrogenase [Candidatus Thermoplasmatota archaeon]
MDIGIIGCGFIGTTIAHYLENMDEIGNIHLIDATDATSMKLASTLKKGESHPIGDIQGFIRSSDLIVEAASQEAVLEYSEMILGSGKDLMVLSVGALADAALWQNMKAAARGSGARIFVPSGAISGLDGIGAASMSGLGSVSLTVRKPPGSLSLGGDVPEETVLFEGSAREAVSSYPKNVNVSAAIALSGAGFENTKVRIIADPNVDRNTHTLKVSGRFGEMTIEMSNMPSDTNPRTSYLAPLSALYMIDKIISGIYIGS